MKALRGIVGTVAVVAWVVMPVVIALVLTARSERSVQSPPITSSWLPAGEVQAELDRVVIATAVMDEASPILAPDWTGLVEQVDLRPGEPLRSGEVVAIVSGVPRLAVHTSRPFRRTLNPDDRGVDVAELNAWLRSRGGEASEGDRFGAATRRGVRALREELGLQRADVESFDPAWIVYLPRPEVVIDMVAFQVGAPVPPAGSIVAEVRAQVATVELVEPDQAAMGGGPSSGRPAGSGDGSAQPGPPAAASPNGDGSTTTAPGSPGTGTASPGGGASGGGTSGVPVTSAAAGAMLRRVGQVLGPVAPDGSLPDETLSALLPLLEGQESISAELVEPAPAGARAIPAAALFTGPTGMTCVSTRTGPGGAVTVVTAFPIAAEVDRVVVGGLPEGPLEVEVNAAAATRRQCQG